MSDYLFSGLKVIDCATVIAAPAAAMILADYGADVIKIEQPGEGDMLRMLGDIPTTPYADSDWFWQLDGRNKRGVALDRPAEGVAGRPSSLWLLGGYQLFFAVLLLLIFRIWLTHQNGSCECGGSPGEIVAKRFCLNFNRGAGSFAVIPVANAKLASY